MDLYQALSTAVSAGNTAETAALCEQAIAAGLSPAMILQQGLLPGMDSANEKFQKNEIFVPQVLLSEHALYAGVDLLRPLFPKNGRKAGVATLPGDRHEKGKNLVGLALEAEGFALFDLGCEAPAETVLSAISEKGCALFCCSITMPQAREEFCKLVILLEQSGVRSKVKLLIGGNAADKAFQKTSGADGYAKTAIEAAALAASFFSDAAAI